MMQQHDGIQEASDDSLAKRPVKFIKNPLPGPKPHVKKEMNYDYEVPPDKMFSILINQAEIIMICLSRRPDSNVLSGLVIIHKKGRKICAILTNDKGAIIIPKYRYTI